MEMGIAVINTSRAINFTFLIIFTFLKRHDSKTNKRSSLFHFDCAFQSNESVWTATTFFSELGDCSSIHTLLDHINVTCLCVCVRVSLSQCLISFASLLFDKLVCLFDIYISRNIYFSMHVYDKFDSIQASE